MKQLLFVLILTVTALGCRCQEDRSGTMLRTFHYTSPWKGTVHKGEEVTFKSVGNDKVKIYVVSEYVSPAIPASWVKAGRYKGMIIDPTDNYVNVRKGPGTNYPIVRTLDVDETIDYEKTKSGWYKVYWGNKFLGYVHKSRIQPGMP